MIIFALLILMCTSNAFDYNLGICGSRAFHNTSKINKDDSYIKEFDDMRYHSLAANFNVVKFYEKIAFLLLCEFGYLFDSVLKLKGKEVKDAGSFFGRISLNSGYTIFKQNNYKYILFAGLGLDYLIKLKANEAITSYFSIGGSIIGSRFYSQLRCSMDLFAQEKKKYNVRYRQIIFEVACGIRLFK